MTLRNEIVRLEAQREALGLSQHAVVRHAQMGHDTVRRWLTGRRTPNRAAVARYRIAIRHLQEGLSRTEGLKLHLYEALLVLVARDHGVCPVLVRLHDPSVRATNSPAWLAAQRVRWDALYLLCEVYGVEKAEIGRLIGVTRQAVQQAVAAVEAARDGDLKPDIPRDAALDARLSALIRDLTEVEL